MRKVETKYRTFDELLDEVSLDFSTFSSEGMIESAQLIKVAQRCNYDLGLKINQTKDTIIEIRHGKAKLPDDFYKLNEANLCYIKKTSYLLPRGRHTEDVLLPKNCPEPEPVIDPCAPCNLVDYACRVVCDKYATVENIEYKGITYDEFHQIRIIPGKLVSDCCPNTKYKCGNHGELKNGYIYLNLEDGNLHINYEGALEDEEGNLLVLDHPMINEYYEFALKSRILENLYFNGEPVEQKLSFVKQELRSARNNALSIVNTPDFAKMKKVWENNRKATYRKYYYKFI